MNTFTKVQIYTKGGKCCFDDIERSKKPFTIININEIVSLDERETWGFCEGNEKYPFRRLHMKDGIEYLCVLESANKLEDKLLNE